MNWEAIDAIGEVVGAIAVVATLVYLAVQVRRNNRYLAENAKIAQASAMEANAHSANHLRELLLTNPDLSELFARGCESRSSLDSEDQLRIGMLMRNMFQASQIGHARYNMFRHDPDDDAGAELTLESLLRRRGIRECFDQAETDSRPEFRTSMESIVQRIDLDRGA